MEASNGISQNAVQQKLTRNINGVQTWTILFFCILAANLVVDNFIKFGLVAHPIQLAFTFIHFLQEAWWIFVVLLGGYTLQLATVYSIEIGLAKNLLSERLGMGLQLFNTMLLYNIFTYLVTVNNVNICAGIAISTHIFLQTTKVWSFVYVNRTLRLRLRETNVTSTEDKKVEDAPSTKYPNTLTLKNFVTFMNCTGKTIYNPEGLKKQPRKLKKFFLRFLMAVAIYYSVAFILCQFVIPELHETVAHFKSGLYFHCLSSLLKLLLPINVGWLLFFYFYCFKFYLPSFGWFYGTEDIVGNLDWWNSENLTVFWTKWNYQVHSWCKEHIFLPVMQCGCSKRTAALAVSFVSGILHDYLLTVPCRTGYGLATIMMMSQVPMAYISRQIQKRYGGRLGNLSVWVMFVSGHLCACLVMYYLLYQ